MFVLSQYSSNDENDLYALLQDQTIHENTLSLPLPYTILHAREFIKESMKKQDSWLEQKKAPLQYCIRDANGNIIGNADLRYTVKGNERSPFAIVGYYLAKEYRGNGIVASAVKQLIANAFSNDWDIQRIEGFVFSFNEASARVLVKCGFKFEGILRNYYVKDGSLFDAKIYSIVRSDFNKN